MVNKFFVLTLDIDETVLNSKTHKQYGYDFNGSQGFNCASGWHTLIGDVRELCRAQGYELALKFLSAKTSGTVDDTIDACHQYFSDEIFLRTSNSKRYKAPTKISYAVQRHVFGKTYTEIFFNKNFPLTHNFTDKGMSFSNTALMPAIHICYQNELENNDTLMGIYISSKACILEKIRRFYGLHTDQMLHVDNANWVATDLKTGAQGKASCFNMIHCHELEQLQKSDKNARTLVANQVFEKIKLQVSLQLQRLSNLQEEIMKEETNIDDHKFGNKDGGGLAKGMTDHISSSSKAIVNEDIIRQPQELLPNSIKMLLLQLMEKQMQLL